MYTSSEGPGKSTYTYAQAHVSLHCSTLRKVPKSNGLIPLIRSFVTSKSILNYANIIFRLQFVSTIMFAFDMLSMNLILSATKCRFKTNVSY